MAATDLKFVDTSNTIEYQRTAINEIASDVHSLFAGTGSLDNGVDLSKLLKESVNIVSGTLSTNQDIYLENGMVHYFTSTEIATSVPNIKYSSQYTLASKLEIGKSASVVLIITSGSAGYSSSLKIDDTLVTLEWLNGSAPTNGNSAGIDVYTYTIIRKDSVNYLVLANRVNYN